MARQAGVIAEVEEVLAQWDRDGEELYDELASRIVGIVLRKYGVNFSDVGND